MSQNNLSNARKALPGTALAIVLAFGCVHAVTTPRPDDGAQAPLNQGDASASLPGVEAPSSGGEESGADASAEEAVGGDGQCVDVDAMSPEERRTHLARMTTPAALEIPDYGMGDMTGEVIEDEVEEDGVDDEALASGEDGNGECPQAPDGEAVRPGVRYSADISDEALAKMWLETPEELGALSIGLPSVGRVVNSKPFPAGDDWVVVNPSRTYGTEETINYIIAAINEVNRLYPDGPSVIRINDIGMPHGGYLQPHQSHQAGRDVDLSFYYGSNGPDRGPWAVDNNFDLDRNWALIRAFITETDVQVVLVDGGIVKRLFDHALKKGEDRAWLDSIFHMGTRSLIRPAKGHRDHFHVRFYNPRAQELGRRVLPLIPKDPSQNLRYHKVCKGDTIGKIAFTFGSTIKAIQEANNLKGTLIRIGQTLAVPMKGPCVDCPMPPEVVIPPRRMPPQPATPLLAAKAGQACSQTPSAIAQDVTADWSDLDERWRADEGKSYDLADYLMPWTQFQTGIAI